MSDVRYFDEPTRQRLIAFAGVAHDEALVCAKAGAFRAASVMVGSAVVLATVATFESELREADNWRKGDPLRWDLGDLLAIAVKAGWLPMLASREPLSLEEGDLGDAVYWVKWLRNLVHPGAFVRELPPELEFGEPAFRNAYLVLEGLFDASARLMQPGEQARRGTGEYVEGSGRVEADTDGKSAEDR